MSLKDLLRLLCPPVVWNALVRIYSPGIVYKGNFATWHEASNASTGYGSDEILGRVISATDRVLAGEAAFERDGVTFSRIEYPYHLIAPMLSAALKADSRLSVLDFGGSLGSTYRQCRPMLSAVSSISWNVIEQNIFVSAGRARYQNDELAFYFGIDEIEGQRRPNVLLFASVLQYLPDPSGILKKATEGTDVSYLMIDRTPFWHGHDDRVLVQEVPRSIYSASYPMWVFSYSRLLAELANDWLLVDDKLSPEGVVRSKEGFAFEYHNLVFRKRTC